jgi:serine/threonine protein kinase
MCRYPFHGAEHSGLFAKIRKGQFSLPDSLSSRAKCLIRSLLRKEPSERLTTEDVLLHPWLTGPQRDSSTAVSRSSGSRRTGGSGVAAATADTADHVVPEFRPLAVVAAAASPAATATSPAAGSSGGGGTGVDPAAAFHLVFRTASSAGSGDQQPGTLSNAHHHRAV